MIPVAFYFGENMATKNDITGDSIISRVPSKAYTDNFDAIFGKKDKNDTEVENKGTTEEQTEK